MKSAIRAMSFCFVILAFLTAAYAYPSMPQMMAVHWGIDGEADGFADRDFGVFFMPLLALAVFGIFMVLPELDPLKENYRSFMREYDTFAALMVSFLYYLYVLTLIYNLGISFDLTRFIAPAAGIIIFYTGILLRKAKQNWFVGIRTPWTMSNGVVWDRTHRLCGGFFQASGVLFIIGIAFQPAIGLALGILFGTAVFGFVYSFLEFRKLKEEAQAAPQGRRMRGKAAVKG